MRNKQEKGGKIKTWNANLGVNVLLLQFDTFLMVPSRTIGMTFIFTYGLFDIVHQSLNAVFLCVIVWDCDLALQECVCVRLICIHLQNIWVIILEKMLPGVSEWCVYRSDFIFIFVYCAWMCLVLCICGEGELSWASLSRSCIVRLSNGCWLFPLFFLYFMHVFLGVFVCQGSTPI